MKGVLDTPSFQQLWILYEAITKTKLDFEKYHLDQIEYPVPAQKVPDLEEILDISFTIISFYDDEGRGLYTMYHTKNERVRHVDLLYYEGHYSWIKDLDRLVNCVSKNGHKVFYHKNCGSHWYT